MKNLKILRLEERWLAVDKPSGLLSVPGRGPQKADCVAARAAAEYGWIREAHRLDEATSGVMLLARDAEAHRRLSALFAERKIQKTYVAICAAGRGGRALCAGDSGRCVLLQRLDPENRPMQVPDPERGKKAVTLWRVLETATGRVRLELRPLTGRTHQLRLACAEMGMPILGDGLYAPPDVAAASERLMLHARSICFPDPFGGELITVESPPPF